MFFTYAQIFALLTQYRYVLLFPIMVIEGPIIAVIGGLLCSVGSMNIVIVFFLSITGDITGDALFYALGRWGRQRVIERWGHIIGLTSERIRSAEHYFDHHAGKTLVLAKLTHAAGGPTLVSAGIVRMPFWPFLWYNLLGTIPKSLFFVTIGYYFGSMYRQINGYIDKISLIVIGILILLVFVLFWRKTRRSTSHSNP